MDKNNINIIYTPVKKNSANNFNHRIVPNLDKYGLKGKYNFD
jgi:hypothetical protein